MSEVLGHAHLPEKLLYLSRRTDLANDRHGATVASGVQSITEKEPFSQYEVLAKNNPPPRGMKVFYGDPQDPSTYPTGTFDVVVDNNGKSMKECQPLIDTFAGSVRLPNTPPPPFPTQSAPVGPLSLC